MARRVRPAGGLASLMGSDSEPDLGGIADGFTSGVKRTTTMKKQHARPTSSHRINKPAASSTSRHTSKTMTSRSPPRRPLVEKERFNARPIAKHSSKTLLSENESDDMELVDEMDRKLAAQPQSPIYDEKPTATKIRSRQQESVSPIASPKRGDIYTARDEVLRVRAPSAGIYEDKLPTKRLVDNPKYVADDSEDAASLRRQLDSLKRKYESLESRHEELKEVAVKEAERNYERLRRHTEESSTTAERLIAQLKEEVKDQTAAAGDADRLRRKLEESQAYCKELLDKISDLKSSSTESEREVKTLTAKLAASRSAEANGKVPGSAVKGNNAKSWTGQSELVHQAHAKEDLYSDLTGLIVRSIEQGDKEDVFDCLQTGRNGTLHFKLALEKEGSKRYEDMKFSYQPQLQDGRDADLIEMLPDYLLEDIEFERPQGPNFYSRIIKALVDKRRSE